MKLNLARELAALERMTVGELHDQYVEVFGEQVRSRHRAYLIRRIAWRLRANAEGGLSERSRNGRSAGFEYAGERYRSLSAVGKTATATGRWRFT